MLGIIMKPLHQPKKMGIRIILIMIEIIVILNLILKIKNNLIKEVVQKVLVLVDLLVQDLDLKKNLSLKKFPKRKDPDLDLQIKEEFKKKLKMLSNKESLKKRKENYRVKFKIFKEIFFYLKIPFKN